MLNLRPGDSRGNSSEWHFASLSQPAEPELEEEPEEGVALSWDPRWGVERKHLLSGEPGTSREMQRLRTTEGPHLERPLWDPLESSSLSWRLLLWSCFPRRILCPPPPLLLALRHNLLPELVPSSPKLGFAGACLSCFGQASC